MDMIAFQEHLQQLTVNMVQLQQDLSLGKFDPYRVNMCLIGIEVHAKKARKEVEKRG